MLSAFGFSQEVDSNAPQCRRSPSRHVRDTVDQSWLACGITSTHLDATGMPKSVHEDVYGFSDGIILASKGPLRNPQMAGPWRSKWT